MKPDLTYCHNSSRSLKNFLYGTFPKKTLAYFPVPSVEIKKFICFSKKFLRF